jgi:hypothetical protein
MGAPALSDGKQIDALFGNRERGARKRHGMSSKPPKPYAMCSNCPTRIERGERRNCKESSCRGALCMGCFRKCHTCDHCLAAIHDDLCYGDEQPGMRHLDLKTNTKITEYFKKRVPAAAMPPKATNRTLDEGSAHGAKRARR